MDSWLYASGWSLDTHDFSRDGEDRSGVNLAALVVPGCLRAFCSDPSPFEALTDRFGGEVWRSDGSHATSRLGRGAADQGVRVPKCASAPMAIWLLGRLYKVQRLYLVGFDAFWGKAPPKDYVYPDGSIGAYAKSSIYSGTPEDRVHRKPYESISRQMRQAAYWSCVELIDGDLTNDAEGR